MTEQEYPPCSECKKEWVIIPEDEWSPEVAYLHHTADCPYARKKLANCEKGKDDRGRYD